MKKYLFALVLAFPLLSFGQAATYPANFDRFMALTTGLASQSIGFSSTGSPVPTTTFSGSGAHVGNLGVFPDAAAGSKGLEVRGGASLSFGKPAVSVPVTAVGKVSAASLGKAFGALAGLAGGWPGLIAAASVPFVMDWMANAGVQVSAVDGSFKRADPAVCSVSPCYEWQALNGGAWYGNALTACLAVAAANASYTLQNVRADYVTGGALTNGCHGDAYYKAGGGLAYTNSPFSNFQSRSKAPVPASWLPATVAEVQTQLATVQPNPYVLSELYNKAVIDNLIPINIVAAGPSSVTGPVTTVTTPAVGSVPASTTTTSTNYNCSYVMETTSCNESQTVTKDGVVTQTQTKPAEPAPTCGLPGTPVCNVKIDETGTSSESKLDPRKTTDDTMKPIKDFALNPVGSLPTLPQMNWSFRLPSGCTALTIPAFAPYLQDIDMCQFTPMFHDIMSVVWVIGALFGATGMFFRNVFATV